MTAREQWMGTRHVDIDHLRTGQGLGVGAKRWTRDTRTRFSNDPLNRRQAATGTSSTLCVDKLMLAGILSSPIKAAGVEQLTGPEGLQVTSGALNVLRTDALEQADRSTYPDDPRRRRGFRVEQSDEDAVE